MENITTEQVVVKIKERLRWGRVFFHLLNYCMLPFLIMLPKKMVLARLQHLLSNRIYSAKCSQILFYKSGRSALCALLIALRKGQNRKIVFVPDYICNVVPKACVDAGFDLQSYPTDDHLVPIWTSLDKLLCNDTDSVLLICSLMGATPIVSAEKRQLVERHSDLFVIADECQNLVEQSPVKANLREAIVFSFNDKTSPGLMGGGIVWATDSDLIPEFQPASFINTIKRSIYFTGALTKRIIRETRHIVKLALNRPVMYAMPESYEYSICQSAHYNTQPESIHRISAAYALLNLRLMKHVTRVRKENCKMLSSVAVYGVANVEVNNSCHAEAPPFMLFSEVSNNVGYYPAPVKAPYAKFNMPEACVKKQYAFKLNIPYVAYR